MHQLLKKITALGLLLLVALPLFFSTLVLVKQKTIQMRRDARFEKESLQTISISSGKLYWVKPGKEILVDGKLFDVKSFYSKADKILLTGFFDNKEDKLVSHIKNLSEQKKGTESPFTKLAVKFLFAPLYNEPASFSCGNAWHNISSGFFSYSEILVTASFPADTPPPKAFA